MTPRSAALAALRAAGCLAVAAGAAAGAAFFGRTLLFVSRSAGPAADASGSADSPGRRPERLRSEWRRGERSAPPGAADTSVDPLAPRAPSKRTIPDDLAVPDGAVADGAAGAAEGPAGGLIALICPLSAAETDRWVRVRMEEFGWSAGPAPPPARGEFRSAFARPDARCWCRIEPRPGGGCRLHYMRLSLEDDRRNGP